MDDSHKVTSNMLEISQEQPEQHKGGHTLESLNLILQEKLTVIINQIRNDIKMHSYLIDLNLAPADLLISYDEIVKSHRRLIEQSKEKPIMFKAVKCYLDMVLAFMAAKNLEGIDSKGRIGWYIEVEIKLISCCHELFLNFKLENDITNSPKEQYSKVWEKINIVKAQNVELIRKQYRDLKRMLHNSAASALNELQHEYLIMQKLMFGTSFLKYMIMNDSSKLRSFAYYRSPTLKVAQHIWNMPEMGATKHLMNMSYESIYSKVKIYLPINGIVDKDMDIFEPRPNSIIIRVLSNVQLVKYPSREQRGCCFFSKKQVKTIDTVIIHLHGGGFIALSSRSMQVFTCKWAKEVGVPVFSIDYRMPPEYPFPIAPHDCLTAYRFIVNHIHEYLNIKPANIYLTGDSAGGNLACSLTGLLLREKQHIPRGIYLIYPNTDLRKIFTSSKVYSLTDPFLWPNVMIMCLKSYLKDEKQGFDPLASPVLLTEQWVGGKQGDKRFPLNWPKTIIDVGNRDPLLDDSLMLMQRMIQANIDCQCTIYQELSHGFFNTGFAVEQCEKTIVNSIMRWKQLIAATQKE